MTRHHVPLAELLAPIPSTPPDLLAERSLLERADTKFLVSVRDLDELLPDLRGSYTVVRSGTAPFALYRTLYFDTPELQCFDDHQRGRRMRQKVRLRQYADRQLSFLEIKTKATDLVTVKHRLAMPHDREALEAQELEFIGRCSRLSAAPLIPQVWIDGYRTTLVGLHSNERVTVDVDLRIRTDGRTEELRGLAVVEVKQFPLSRSTPVMEVLRRRGFRPQSISKYCTAMALTRACAPSNRLLPTLRLVEKRGR